MNEKEINISIAGRQYRLLENNQIKQFDLEMAAMQINQKIADYETTFKVTDMHDLMAMVLLDYAIKSNNVSSKSLSEAEVLIDSHLSSLHSL